MTEQTEIHQIAQCLDFEGPATCNELARKFGKTPKLMRSQLQKLRSKNCCIPRQNTFPAMWIFVQYPTKKIMEQQAQYKMPECRNDWAYQQLVRV
jgi:hypothetical protein